MSELHTLFYEYDPGASVTYGRFLDINPSKLDGFIETSGSSTTTTAVESTGLGSFPFAPCQAGDHLLVVFDDVSDNLRRSIATKTSNSSVVVNAAWDLSGNAAYFLPFRSGTGAGDGWVSTAGAIRKFVKINVTTLGSTSVVLTLEGKMAGPDATGTDIVAPTSYTIAGEDYIVIAEDWAFVRAGLNQTGSGTDSVSVYLTLDFRAIGS